MANRQIYQLDEDSISLVSVLPFQVSGGEQEANKTTFQDVKNLLIPYAVYRALVSQSSTGAPTPLVLQDELTTISFSRSGVGVYSIDSPAFFTVNKTMVTPQYSTIRIGANYTSVDIELNTTSAISIQTYIQGVASDDVLNNFPIEILVYL